MAITIDPANKRLILDSASVTAQSIYVAWVDWVATSDNSKYLPAFSSVGGDALGGGLFIPPYYFLTNGWRVRPMESSHNLTITGNLFVDGGGVPVVSTLGTFQVNVNYTVPVQAQGISTSGGSGASAADVWAYGSRTLTQSIPTAAEIADAVGARVIEAGFTNDEILKLAAAVLLGRVTGATTNTVKFIGLDDTTERVIANVDQNGNRQGVTLTP